MRFALLLATALLAGCTSSSMDGAPATKGKDGPALPPISIAIDNQAHTLTYQGGESTNRWDNVTITASKGCHQDAPTEGAMVPGQIVHVTADAAIRQCTVAAEYQGTPVDAWVFHMEAE